MRILLIVQPERSDFYSYLGSINGIEWLLLWYEKEHQMTLGPGALPIRFSRIYYWTQFTTPNELLEEIKPDRIVFFEIIDLRQIALNVTAMRKRIPTFYLEHGAAGDKHTAMQRQKERSFKKDKLPYLWNRLKTSLTDVLKSKLFYYSVTKGFSSFHSYWKYVLLPVKMLRDTPNKVLANNIFPERVPSKSIVFNQVNFEEFALYTGIKKIDALLTGVPFFDKFYREEYREEGHVVYIDHPYLEQNLLNWKSDHHEKIAKLLFDFAEKTKTPLYVKLHPSSSRAIWESYGYNQEYVKVLQKGDFTDLFLTAKLILGFSSSLINGFLCARKNIVLLGWHPDPHIFGSDFSKTGLCHVSFYPEELMTHYEVWLAENLATKNKSAYTDFLTQYNYPFDGKATERVIDAITHEST